jgi:hypothetical protein
VRVVSRKPITSRCTNTCCRIENVDVNSQIISSREINLNRNRHEQLPLLYINMCPSDNGDFTLENEELRWLKPCEKRNSTSILTTARVLSSENSNFRKNSNKTTEKIVPNEATKRNSETFKHTCVPFTSSEFGQQSSV